MTDSIRLSDNVDRQVTSLPSVLAEESEAVRSKAHLIRLLLNNNRSLLTVDNRIGLLINGDKTFSGNEGSNSLGERFYSPRVLPY